VKAQIRTGTVFIATLMAAMALGGSFYEALVVYPAWSVSPPASLAVLQGPHAVDSTLFWILVHVTFETALVTGLALNWRSPRRRTLLLAGLAVHVVMRAWTFAYFVPEILAFTNTPPEGPFSPELAARTRLWGALGWVRRVMIAATSVLVLAALTTPVNQDEQKACRERPRSDEARAADAA
jgi:hypothetical protein